MKPQLQGERRSTSASPPQLTRLLLPQVVEVEYSEPQRITLVRRLGHRFTPNATEVADVPKQDEQVKAGQPDIVIAPREGSGLSTAAGERAERAATALPALGEALAGPAAEFWTSLTKNAAIKPSEVEIRLGLSFEGGTKWAIVATVGATIDVSLKWTST